MGLPLLVCGWGGFALLLCLFDLVFCGGWGGLCLLVGLCVCGNLDCGVSCELCFVWVGII